MGGHQSLRNSSSQSTWTAVAALAKAPHHKGWYEQSGSSDRSLHVWASRSDGSLNVELMGFPSSNQNLHASVWRWNWPRVEKSGDRLKIRDKTVAVCSLWSTLYRVNCAVHDQSGAHSIYISLSSGGLVQLVFSSHYCVSQYDYDDRS